MRKKNKPAPYLPALLDSIDSGAIKALATGTANEGQQTRALSVIVNKLCGTYDLPYYPDSARDSDFAQGKRFVGLQIIKELNLPTPPQGDA